MRFDNYILKLSDRPGYPEAMELNGDAFDFNTFRKMYAELNYIFNHGINDTKGESNQDWYKVWVNMIRRCTRSNQKAYDDVSVCFSWLKASNFKNWYDENIYRIVSDSDLDRLHLDKDIKHIGNRLYSPDTCYILPGRINHFYVNSNPFMRSYVPKSDGYYNTSMRGFDAGERVNFSSKDPLELALLRAREKDRQLKDKVIPYFKNIVHPDDRNLPMVKAILETLKNHSFEAIQVRNQKLFESIASEVDELVPPEERTQEKLDSMQDIIADIALKHAADIEDFMTSVRMSKQDIYELFDILTGILSKYTDESKFIRKDT